MGNKKMLILGCVMGISYEDDVDWSKWTRSIVLLYCAAKEAVPDRLNMTEYMAKLQSTGFMHLALVARVLASESHLEILIADDTPKIVRQSLLERSHEIFDEAMEHENLRGAA
jgi:hypothetical protein